VCVGCVSRGGQHAAHHNACCGRHAWRCHATPEAVRRAACIASQPRRRRFLPIAGDGGGTTLAAAHSPLQRCGVGTQAHGVKACNQTHWHHITQPLSAPLPQILLWLLRLAGARAQDDAIMPPTHHSRRRGCRPGRRGRPHPAPTACGQRLPGSQRRAWRREKRDTRSSAPAAGSGTP
jgi:hypothetical protein